MKETTVYKNVKYFKADLIYLHIKIQFIEI